MRKLFMRMAASVLALMLTLSAAGCGGEKPGANTGSNSTQAEKDGFVPVSVSVAYKAEQFASPDGFVVMESSIDIPTVSGGGEGAAAKIQKHLDKEIGVIESDLSSQQEIASELIQDGYTGPAGYYEMKLSTIRSDEQAVTLLNSTDVYYMGAAHPGHILVAYNFNPETGEQIRLSSLGINGGDPSEDIIYLLARKFVDSQYSTDYSYGMDNAVDDIAYLLSEEIYSAYDNWYISGDTFVFISNEYNLASYAAGWFVITLTAEELEGVVDKKWFADGETYLPEGLRDGALVDGSTFVPDNDPENDGFTGDYNQSEIDPEELDPSPFTTLYGSETASRFSYIYTAEIPSDYITECLIWWNCDVYDIIIYELEWDENLETVVGGNIVYEQSDCTPDDAILFSAFIPEVIPSHGMSITVNGVRYHWALAYNGLDGGLSFMPIDPQAAG